MKESNLSKHNSFCAWTIHIVLGLIVSLCNGHYALATARVFYLFGSSLTIYSFLSRYLMASTAALAAEVVVV